MCITCIGKSPRKGAFSYMDYDVLLANARKVFRFIRKLTTDAGKIMCCEIIM